MNRHFKFLPLFLSLALLFSMIVPFHGVNAEENSVKTITILHTNDSHSRVKEGKYDGMGFAKIATLVKQYKADNPNILLLDAGDTFHGKSIATLVRGESIAKIMDKIGYDVMTAGNHDFNYGYERLLELNDMTVFPILAANVYKEDGTRLLTPYVIKELDGIKIGIFGLATPETAYKTHPKNVEGLTFADPVEEAKKMVAELEDQVDVIISLAHLGVDESSKDTSIKVAEEVQGIDLIIDGHSHTTFAEGKLVGDTLIASAGEYLKNLGVVTLTFEDGQLIDKKASLVTKEEAADVEEDQEVLALENTISEEQNEILSEVIGKTAVPLDGAREHVRAGETNLGNLITDAMLEISGADVALTNGGGIRTSIEAGEITKGKVIEVLPFGNYIITKKVKGSVIKAALENGVDAYPDLKGAFPHVGGMTFTLDPSKPAGERVISILINGEPIEMEKEYILATNDFMAYGGDKYTMLKDTPTVNEYPALDEALISYIQQRGTVEPKVEGRLVIAEPEPAPKPEPKPEPTQVPALETTTYTVQSGDVLWKIAKKFNTTWQKLQELNQLKNPHLIFPGQKLLVPVP